MSPHHSHSSKIYTRLRSKPLFSPISVNHSRMPPLQVINMEKNKRYSDPKKCWSWCKRQNRTVQEDCGLTISAASVINPLRSMNLLCCSGVLTERKTWAWVERMVHHFPHEIPHLWKCLSCQCQGSGELNSVVPQTACNWKLSPIEQSRCLDPSISLVLYNSQIRFKTKPNLGIRSFSRPHKMQSLNGQESPDPRK